MNKPQRIVLGITLILMGIIIFIYVAHVWLTIGPEEIDPFVVYIFCLLSIIFVGGGVFIMVSKKKR